MIDDVIYNHIETVGTFIADYASALMALFERLYYAQLKDISILQFFLLAVVLFCY
jgi:hypothetical protein